jgi:predicted Fe-Mo cluster-binding NifX family protein
MVMLIAIPIWEGRVSPVFDVAQRLALTTIESGAVINTAEMPLPSQDVMARVKLLAERKVDVLLCGAISGCVLGMLEESSIRVVPYVCGPVEQVIDAFLKNRLARSGLVMPGCGCGRDAGNGGRQRRRRRGWCRNQQEPGKSSL